eukprot:CAMPEP_0115681378 /NCGR_PEP_ID=MMETSP0272-20121206/57293_1 /TAXON_ID=71861 /ORGANISM="Scrippsiella trochoidea, Strain CCMP3099" /LENGTH=72 /DNA_ID=CAMNT_0003120691 /DNA_START=286 /DNA_END=504 /DNA_ORIENTATION=+
MHLASLVETAMLASTVATSSTSVSSIAAQTWSAQHAVTAGDLANRSKAAPTTKASNKTCANAHRAHTHPLAN